MFIIIGVSTRRLRKRLMSCELFHKWKMLLCVYKTLGQFMNSWLWVVPVSLSSHALSDKLSGTFECLPRVMSSFWRVEQGYLGFHIPLFSPRYFLTTVKRGSSRCKETLVLM